jgi:hypothetical protein
VLLKFEDSYSDIDIKRRERRVNMSAKGTGLEVRFVRTFCRDFPGSVTLSH